MTTDRLPCHFNPQTTCHAADEVHHLCELCNYPNKIGWFFCYKNGKEVAERRFIHDKERRGMIQYQRDLIETAEQRIAELEAIPTYAEWEATQ